MLQEIIAANWDPLILPPIVVIYATIIILLTQSSRDRKRRTRRFSRALKTALHKPEHLNSEKHLDGVLWKVESFFEQSQLSRNYRSAVEALEYLHYLMHEGGEDEKGVYKGWTAEDRKACEEVLERLRSRRPFAALQGDSQRLLGAARGHLKDGQGGADAIQELADHIKSMEKRVSNEKRKNRFNLALTVFGALVAALALAAQVAIWLGGIESLAVTDWSEPKNCPVLQTVEGDGG